MPTCRWRWKKKKKKKSGNHQSQQDQRVAEVFQRPDTSTVFIQVWENKMENWIASNVVWSSRSCCLNISRRSQTRFENADIRVGTGLSWSWGAFSWWLHLCFSTLSFGSCETNTVRIVALSSAGSGAVLSHSLMVIILCVCVCVCERERSQWGEWSESSHRPVTPRVCYYNSTACLDAYIHTHTQTYTHIHTYIHASMLLILRSCTHTHTHTHTVEKVVKHNSLINSYLTCYQSSANSTHAPIHRRSSLTSADCVCVCVCVCVCQREQALVLWVFVCTGMSV